MELIIFVLGSAIGSFLNLCIYRIPKGESIVYPSSHCINCNNKLKWYDLIPIISYMFLKGKCRYCENKISIGNPILEVITGVLFVALYVEYGFSFYLIKYLVFVSLIIVIGMIDYETTDIFLAVSITGIILGSVFILGEFYLYKIGIILEFSLASYLYGALFGGGVIGLIVFLTHGMGLGDIEICAVSGLFLGFKLSIVMIFVSMIVGGIIGTMLSLLKLKRPKDYIPFGPFVATACIIAVFYGEKMIDWYLKVMF